MCVAAKAGDSIHLGRSLGEMVQGGTGDTGGRQRVGVRKYIKGCRGPKGGPRIHPRYLSERGLS